MKKISFLLFCTITFNLFAQKLPSEFFKKKSIKVMVLGTFHMANPGLDAANIKSDNIKSEKRQKEINQLVKRLAKFKPTKIAIERSYGKNNFFNEKYRRYLVHKNSDSLSKSEAEQIGFRLASLLNHHSIYSIDYRSKTDVKSMQEFLKKNPSTAKIIGESTQNIQNVLDKLTKEKLYNGSVIKFLKYMNTNEIIYENHLLYMEFLKLIGSGKNYGGVDMVSSWYKRNLAIFHNLTRITDFENPEDERILVIFGQGHSYLLKQFTKDALYYELIDVLKYL